MSRSVLLTDRILEKYIVLESFRRTISPGHNVFSVYTLSLCQEVRTQSLVYPKGVGKEHTNYWGPVPFSLARRSRDAAFSL